MAKRKGLSDRQCVEIGAVLSMLVLGGTAYALAVKLCYALADILSAWVNQLIAIL